MSIPGITINIRRNFFTPLNFYRLEDMKRDGLGVLIIDMQREFLKRLLLKDIRRILSGQKKILELCAEENYPVIALEYFAYDRTILGLRRCIGEVPCHEFLQKEWNNGFEDTNLSYMLGARGIKSVLLTGVESSACVRETAEGALESGFQVLAAGDLMSDNKESAYTDLDWFRENCCYLGDRLR